MPFRQEENYSCFSCLCVLVFLQLAIAVCGVVDIVVLANFEEITYLRFYSREAGNKPLERIVFADYIRYFLFATAAVAIGWTLLATLFISCGCMINGKLLIRVSGALDLLIGVACLAAACLAGIRAQELEGPIYLSKITALYKSEILGVHMDFCNNESKPICVMMKITGQRAQKAQKELLILLGLMLTKTVGLVAAAFIKLLSKEKPEEFYESNGKYLKPVIV